MTLALFDDRILANLQRLAKAKAIICISHSGSAVSLADRSIAVQSNGCVE